MSNLQLEDDRKRAFDRSDLVSFVWHQITWWFGMLFISTKKAFTGQFIQLHVDGHNFTYKMERNQAWNLDDGKVLENLVKILRD